MSHDTYLTELCHDVNRSYHERMCLVAHVNESCRTYKWVKTHLWISQDSLMNKSCRAWEYNTHMNESCHPCEWVSEDAEYNTHHSFIYVLYSQYEKHMNESCENVTRIWMSHVSEDSEYNTHVYCITYIDMCSYWEQYKKILNTIHNICYTVHMCVVFRINTHVYCTQNVRIVFVLCSYWEQYKKILNTIHMCIV